MIKALAFDVFGTVLDWAGTIIEEGIKINPKKDWNNVAHKWMRVYGDGVAAIKPGQYKRLDEILSNSFSSLNNSFREEQYQPLKDVWCRLKPWDDSIKGFAKLKGRYRLAALTNANVDMLEKLSKTLPWDVLLSSELVRSYKPDHTIYQMAIQKLGLDPEEILMVASHTFDLNAANRAYMKTALVVREGEPGSSPKGLDHIPYAVVDNIDILADVVLTSGNLLNRIHNFLGGVGC